nr:MAG TPA: hypothetical protein [Caudoviricetes sp.]DAT04536.1 MAG TPA: hypothetical protein [Bacteriophage sp.]
MAVRFPVFQSSCLAVFISSLLLAQQADGLLFS